MASQIYKWERGPDFPPPYVGVTGFTDSLQLRVIHEHLRHRLGLETEPPQFMAGVLVSYKTLNGNAPEQSGRYPPTKMLPEIYRFKYPSLLYLAHYNSRVDRGLYDQLVRLSVQDQTSTAHT